MQAKIGFPGLLGLLFVALKLCGVIQWSWWFVTMPFWIVLAVLGAALMGIGSLWAVCTVLIAFLERRRLHKKHKNEKARK